MVIRRGSARRVFAPLMVATAVGLVFWPAAASAQPKTGTASGTLASSDEKFVTDAARGSAAEVELGKLAAQRASDAAVKQLGQRIAADHGKAGEELDQLARRKGMSAPKEPAAKHRELHERLAKLSGIEFDRAYLAEMIKDHRREVTEFRKQAQGAQDPDLKAWAVKTLPTLQDHLKMVEDLWSRMKRR